MTIPLTYPHYFHCLPFSFTPFLFPSFRAWCGIQKHRPIATENHNSQTHITKLLDTAFLRYDNSAYISSLLSQPPIFVRPSFFPSFRAWCGIQKHRPTATEKHNSQTHTTVFLNTAFLRYDLAVSEQHSKRLEAKFFLYYFLTQTDEFYNFAHENRWA